MPPRGAIGWAHLLTRRKKMLDVFDEAAAQTRGKALPVKKGIVAENAVRDWLSDFLPLRFGVTAGYIIPPVPEEDFRISHFDVIIYDRLNAPILWSESDHVRAIS